MKTNLKSLLACICVVISLSSFSVYEKNPNKHFPVLKTYEQDKAGNTLIKTQITLDKHTSREGLIEACAFLAKENVSLTFEGVTIRKWFLGIAGKNRIGKLKGRISLPNGKFEEFKAGGAFNFTLVRIIFTQVKDTDKYTIQMVEVID
jgi:hypothetical protein